MMLRALLHQITKKRFKATDELVTFHRLLGEAIELARENDPRAEPLAQEAEAVLYRIRQNSRLTETDRPR